MKHLFQLLLLSALFSSCNPDDDYQREYSATEIHRIPYGQSATMSSGNYSGQGNVTNVAGTTVNIEGYTTVDALSINGRVNVPAGATLVVNDVLNVGGGSKINIKGTVITKTFTQVGNTYLSSAILRVNGKYTIGGGTTLYIENANVEVEELVITGHIQAVENTFTKAANWYSLIELRGNKYLNRSAGTNICGPLLFNSNNDQGSTEAVLTDVTAQAVSNNDNVKLVYGIADTTTLYQYDDNCTPLMLMPN